MEVRERMVAYGPPSATDAELLAEATAISLDDAKKLLDGRRLLDVLFMGQEEIAQVCPDAEVLGLSHLMQVLLELSGRVHSTSHQKGERIKSSRDVADIFMPRLRRLPYEEFWVVVTNVRNQPLGEVMVARGGISSCPTYPSDVIRPVFRLNGSQMICVHNHPSGDSTPSPEDIDITQRIAKVMSLLELKLTDHLIIGSNDYFSFLDAGLMDSKKE